MRTANYAQRDQAAQVVFYVPLWKRKGISLELFDDYWRNVHGPVCARLPGQYQYWQLHVAHNEGGVWPTIDGIDYTTPQEDRLRYEVNVRKGQPSQAPAVVFIRQAMEEPNVKIGVICHGLWLLCAADVLDNRRVTCAHNILVDVENAGADIIYENDIAADIVIDENLVTGRHPDLVNKFMETLVREVENKQRSLHAAMTV